MGSKMSSFCGKVGGGGHSKAKILLWYVPNCIASRQNSRFVPHKAKEKMPTLLFSVSLGLIFGLLFLTLGWWSRWRKVREKTT